MRIFFSISFPKSHQELYCTSKAKLIIIIVCFSCYNRKKINKGAEANWDENNVMEP